MHAARRSSCATRCRRRSRASAASCSPATRSISRPTTARKTHGRAAAGGDASASSRPTRKRPRRSRGCDVVIGEKFAEMDETHRAQARPAATPRSLALLPDQSRQGADGRGQRLLHRPDPRRRRPADPASPSSGRNAACCAGSRSSAAWSSSSSSAARRSRSVRYTRELHAARDEVDAAQCRPRGAGARAHRRPRAGQRRDPALRLYRHATTCARRWSTSWASPASSRPRVKPLQALIDDAERGGAATIRSPRGADRRRPRTCRRRSASSAPRPRKMDRLINAILQAVARGPARRCSPEPLDLGRAGRRRRRGDPAPAREAGRRGRRSRSTLPDDRHRPAGARAGLRQPARQRGEVPAQPDRPLRIDVARRAAPGGRDRHRGRATMAAASPRRTTSACSSCSAAPARRTSRARASASPMSAPLVRNLGGDITCTPTLGEGTTFTRHPAARLCAATGSTAS